MVDARRLNRLLEKSQQDGFKLVLVGDPAQLSPIEAGCGLRTVMEKTGYETINIVQRQKEEWQREATKMFAQDLTYSALKEYDQRNHIHLVEDAKNKLIEKYQEKIQTSLPGEQLNCMILAHRRKDVKEFNQMAREIVQSEGRLQGPDQIIKVNRIENEEDLVKKAQKVVSEEKAFAVGDQIIPI